MLFGGSLQADQVFLKNGDRLSGRIVKLTDGKLVLKSELAGEVTIDLANIQTLASDEPHEVHLKDGTVLNQKLSTSEPDQFAIDEGEALRAQTFPLADLVSINPPAKPKPKWTGTVSAALTSTHGNTKAEAISASANMSKRTEKDRTTVSADYGKAKQRDKDTGEDETIEDWWRAKGKYDYFFYKKFFAFVDGRYEKDSVAELDRRVTVGGGGGYQWIESEDMSFSTEAGIASLYEKFDNQTDSNSELSMQAGYNLDKKIAEGVRFFHDLTYYPAFDKFSDYYLTTTAEVRAALVKNMFANFKVIFNYDATPAIGQGSTDTKYLFGVGLTF
jgi:putative salt-induced outer membrane protein YdiY